MAPSALISEVLLTNSSRPTQSASRAFPNRGRHSQRYKSVQALLLHWKTDDLFVLPELEDLEACFREDYGFNTDTFAIPSDNPHLDLMMRIGSLIKDHEAEDTLFVIYYGGHAKIDESRQSTWCAYVMTPRHLKIAPGLLTDSVLLEHGTLVRLRYSKPRPCPFHCSPAHLSSGGLLSKRFWSVHHLMS